MKIVRLKKIRGLAKIGARWRGLSLCGPARPSNCGDQNPGNRRGFLVKGRGVSFMESVPIWHYRSPNKEEYAKAIAELAEVTS